MFRLFRILLLLCIFANTASAALTIEVIGGSTGATPIAIVPFSWNSNKPAPVDISNIITNDLRLSGRFAPIDKKAMISSPHKLDDVDLKEWRMLGISNLVIGSVSSLDDGRLEVSFQLLNTYQLPVQRIGLRYKIAATSKELRRLGHKISDTIYEKLTGERGVAGTQIIYVSVHTDKKLNKRDFALEIADADGFNPQTLLKSAKPIMSPAWSPDGKNLAYVSFEKHRSQIWVQDIYSGKRQLVAAYKGTNGAPAWSPDGKKLALALSKDGNSEIYTLDLASKKLHRVTRSPGIDTEPAWSSNGKELTFTSDRGGSPQIYRKPVYGGKAKRLTFEGRYNARASLSADNKEMALLHGRAGWYRIAVHNLESTNLRILTESKLDESPSFSPNGRMVAYATRERSGKGVLYIVSADGGFKQRLSLPGKDVREPAWSPFKD